MSIIGTVQTVSEELEKKIQSEVVVKKKVTTYGPRGIKVKYEDIRPIRVVDNVLYIPFDWTLKNTPLKRKEREEFSAIGVHFVGTLNEQQKEVKSDCLARLNKNGSILLSLHVGFGKTILAIYLATKIGLKTMIITHRNVLYNQWQESIEQFSDSKSVSVVKAGKVFDTDFVIVSPENIKKIGSIPFKEYGLVIIDEIHCILAEKLSECLCCISPRFLIGLSATPSRPDGLDSLLDLYFGKGNIIAKELNHPHIVYRIDTQYEYEATAKEWNNMLNFQCNNEKRNVQIVTLVLKHPLRSFLILTKRSEQATFLHELLTEKQVNSALLIGNKNTYDQEATVIVATYSKCSTGFSCKKLDALILASDVISDSTEDYMVQIIGRIFRTKEVQPIIFDIVDKQKVFLKHFNVRKKCYLKHGGKIELYKDF